MNSGHMAGVGPLLTCFPCRPARRSLGVLLIMAGAGWCAQASQDADAAWRAADDSWCGRELAEAHRKLARIERADGTNAPAAMPLWIKLGELARLQGCQQEALAAYQRALDIAQDGLKHIRGDVVPPMRNLVQARYALGVYYRATEAYAKAEATLRDAQAAGTRFLKPNDADTARAAGALASVMSTRGDPEQARQLNAWAANEVMAACGSNDTEVAWIADMMGRACMLAGQPDAALPVYDHMLRIRRASLPPEHPDLADALNRLASAHYELDQGRKAIPLLKEALEIRLRAFGPDHPKTTLARQNLEHAQPPAP